jgi:hypothetical protein
MVPTAAIRKEVSRSNELQSSIFKNRYRMIIAGKTETCHQVLYESFSKN